jgi:hypothetical protein
MESLRYTAVIALQLTSLMRGFIRSYYFRVKLVAPHATHEIAMLASRERLN